MNGSTRIDQVWLKHGPRTTANRTQDRAGAQCRALHAHGDKAGAQQAPARRRHPIASSPVAYPISDGCSEAAALYSSLVHSWRRTQGMRASPGSCYVGGARTQGARMAPRAPRGASPHVWDTQAHDRHRRAVSTSCMSLPLRSPTIRSPVRPSCVNAAVYSCYLGHLCTIRPESVRFALGECGHHRRAPGADRLHPWVWSTLSTGRPSRPRVPDLQTGKDDTPARHTCTGDTREGVPRCPGRGATVRGVGVAYGPSMEECSSALLNGHRASQQRKRGDLTERHRPKIKRTIRTQEKHNRYNNTPTVFIILYYTLLYSRPVHGTIRLRQRRSQRRWSKTTFSAHYHHHVRSSNAWRALITIINKERMI